MKTDPTQSISISRHNALFQAVLLSSAAAVGLSAPEAMAKKPLGKPNIIFILADDLGYGDLGCYGQKHIHTPNIDRMASEGLLFTQHYAGCTVSAPSRSVLMTGLHTGHTPIRGNAEHKPEGQEPLPEGTLTIASVLKQAGYTTGAFGKWGLGYPGSSGDPNNMGFDEFYGYNCQRLAHSYYPDHLWHNQDKVILEGNAGEKRTQYSQDLIQREALKFIESNSGKPFFAFLPYVIPHAELTVPEGDELLNEYASVLPEEKSYYGVDSPSQSGYKTGGYCSAERPRAEFAAMVGRLDKYVGEIIAKIEELGISDNTIVVFTSDNGPHAEGGADPDFFQSSGPLRGIKRDLYEGGIREPLVVRWPAKIKEGRTSALVCAFWDFFPTLEDCAGIKTAEGLDGISFYPALTGRKRQKTHEYLYWEFHEQGGKVAVRYGDWKGIKLKYGTNPDAPMELYNLKEDISESHDVASEHPEIVSAIEEIINTARTPSERFNFGR